MSANPSAPGNPGAEAEFTLSRSFDAPRQLVWDAWTKPELLRQWWGPKGFTMRECNVDLRPGGIFHYCMLAPNGNEMWGKFTYQEVVPPERLVFLNSFSDAAGGSARNPWLAVWPLELHNTVTFSEDAGRTTVSLRATPYNASEAESAAFTENRPNMEKGFAGTFAQLDEFLKQAQEDGNGNR